MFNRKDSLEKPVNVDGQGGRNFCTLGVSSVRPPLCQVIATAQECGLEKRCLDQEADSAMWAAALLILVLGLATGPEAAFEATFVDDCPSVVGSTAAAMADKVLRVTVLLPSETEAADKADPHTIVYNNQLEKGFSSSSRPICYSASSRAFS